MENSFYSNKSKRIKKNKQQRLREIYLTSSPDEDAKISILLNLPCILSIESQTLIVCSLLIIWEKQDQTSIIDTIASYNGYGWKIAFSVSYIVTLIPQF